MRTLVPHTISLALVVILGLLGWVSSQRVSEREVVTILSSHDADLALPVFAQFTVTQSLWFKEPLLVNRFVVPMYLPREAVPIRLTLRQDGKVISRWSVPPPPRGAGEQLSAGIHEIEVLMPAPRWLAGKLELHFDGSGIEYDRQGQAPRLFTESDDTAYPGGNYRIAENEKQGDVSLRVYEQVTVSHQRQEQWRAHPWRVAVGYLRWAPMLMLVWALPILFVRKWDVPTSHQSTYEPHALNLTSGPQPFARKLGVKLRPPKPAKAYSTPK